MGYKAFYINDLDSAIGPFGSMNDFGRSFLLESRSKFLHRFWREVSVFASHLERRVADPFHDQVARNSRLLKHR